MKSILSSIIAAAIVSVVLLGAALPSLDSNNLGGVYNNPSKTYFQDGIVVSGATSTVNALTLGSSGTALAQIVKGTCNLVGGSIAATSSAPADCAVTGVKSGDIVLATLATSTNGVITGARASSTDGYITVRVFNLTGAASSVSALGSSTAYFILR